jgi:hypothetical protein
MKPTTMIPVGALVLALSAGASVANAGQRDREGRDRNGRQSQGQTRERGDGGNHNADRGRTDAQPPQSARDDRNASRDAGRPAAAPERNAARPEAAPERVAPERGAVRGDAAQSRGRDVAPDRREGDRGRLENRGGVAVPRPNDRRYENGRNDERWRDERGVGPRGGRDAYRDDRYRSYNGPRVIPGRPGVRHYYGSGGGFSVYFGVGSGYLFGSPYSGRVYGYLAPRSYGARIYYGDVRLQVSPRDASVFVDGYYAGIVDDFDGVFQRLTLEVGAHQIELDAPGLEPQFFDVYVDPARTVDIRADLYRY